MIIPHICYNEAVLTPKFKGKAEDIWHSVLQSSDTEAVETVTDVSKINSESLFSTDKTKDLLSLLSQSSDNITVKLPKYENTYTIGCSNYVDVAQGSPEWFTNRIGMIAVSKLPALLGVNGHKEFDTAWFCINNKRDESIYRPKRFKNFERGKLFEKAALDDFGNISGVVFLFLYTCS